MLSMLQLAIMLKKQKCISGKLLTNADGTEWIHVKLINMQQ